MNIGHMVLSKHVQNAVRLNRCKNEVVMDKYAGIIGSDLFTSYYVDGKLKCEDCVYNQDECKAKFKRCMANVISPEGATHLIWCEKDYIDNMKAQILEVMELIHKK